MRSRTLLVAGVGAAAIALAGCSTTISGSAAPQGADTGSSGHGVAIHTVADLGAAVQHNAAAASSVHMVMAITVPGLGDISANGDAKFAGAQTAEQMSMNIPSLGAMKMVLVSGTFYMQLPSSLAGVMGGTQGKPWVKMDLGGSDPLAQSLGSEANLANQADPTQLLKQITAAGTISKVAPDTLNGVPTTHYTITVNVAKMVQTMTGDQQEKEALSQLGITTMPFDIWVNSSNLPVQIVTSLAYPDPMSGSSQQVKVTVNYTDWGKPVNIAAPPASEVTSLGGN